MLGELSVLVWVTQTTNRKPTIRKSNSKSYNERITLGSKKRKITAENTYHYDNGR